MLGFEFEVIPSDVAEDFHADTDPYELPIILSERKAASFNLKKDEKVLTADTVVILDNQIFNKPVDRQDAKRMLNLLSGKTHDVVTGFCVRSISETLSQKDIARVTFRNLSDEEIDFYLDNQSPLDKAGAYGIQDWIGLSAVTGIHGSFYTVMGLPTHLVYDALKK